jgi:hypothetical protein
MSLPHALTIYEELRPYRRESRNYILFSGG